MKSETKLKILRILFVISLIITILFISNTYAKYQENIATTYNIGIKKWNIKLEEQHFDSARGNNKTGNYIGINDALKASKTLSQIIEPTLIDSEYVSDNTIAPGREGYLEFDVDYSQVDVPFTFDFSLNQTSSILDFEQYAFVVNDGVTYNDVTFYNLPTGYKQVEYIESTGTQYIDTGLVTTENLKTNIDFQLTAITEGSVGITGGWGYIDGTVPNGMLFGTNDNKFQFAYGYGWNGDRTTADLLRHTAIINDIGEKCTLDNVVLADSSDIVNTKNINENVYIFWTPKGTSNKASMKLYSCKIYQDNDLAREFVPCYKEAVDGSVEKAGLYDFVTDSFYANRGTGDFTIPKDADGNPIVIDLANIILNKDTDTQNSTNIKAYIRWDDSIENQMDNIKDTKYTLENNTVNFNVNAVFTQYTGEEE